MGIKEKKIKTAVKQNDNPPRITSRVVLQRTLQIAIIILTYLLSICIISTQACSFQSENGSSNGTATISALTTPFISEIMYNPAGDDNNHEFIEIYGTDNLSGYLIGDLKENDSLSLKQFFAGNTSIIVEEGFNFTGINASVFSAGSTIGDDLNNNGDTIFLYFSPDPIQHQGVNITLVDRIQYNSTAGNGNGKSIEVDSPGINRTWHESSIIGGTPGYAPWVLFQASGANETFQNSSVQNGSGENNETSLGNSTNQTLNQTFNENLNESGETDWTESNQTENNSNLPGNDNCKIIKEIRIENNLNKTIFSEGSIKYRHILGRRSNYTGDSDNSSDNPENAADVPFQIEYWIEDMQGNILRQKTITENANEKSYTPSYFKGPNVLFLKANLKQENCTDSYSEILVIVNGTNAESAEIGAGKSSSCSCPKTASPSCPSTQSLQSKQMAATSCKDAISQTKKQTPLVIESFYYRNKNWNQTIRVYARITGQGNIHISLVGPAGQENIQRRSIEINDSAGSVELSFEINPPNNPASYILAAEDNASQKDFKTILVNLTRKETKESAESIIPAGGESKQVTVSKSGQTSKATNSDSPGSSQLASGNTIYSATIDRVAGQGAIIICILGIAAFLLFRHYKRHQNEGKSDCVGNSKRGNSASENKASETIDL